jgi:RNA polymerase sigma-70 factor (ECF subfamily)
VNDILHDPALTEDVLQDTFIKAVHKIGEFRGESKFSSWLYRIAVNRALDVLRQRKRMKLWMPFSQDEKEETINQIPDQHSTAQRPEEHELGQTIRQAMQKLSPEHRAVVQLRLVEGFSTEETAHILRCSKGTVLSRLFYASKKLRKLLQRYETS